MKNFILDVDGVLTTGQFLYSSEGKMYKIFGAHDADGLKLIKNIFAISFITADSVGFDISNARVTHMGYTLTLVSEADRYDYFKTLGFDNTIFMGDGYFDAPILEKCCDSIAPQNARIEAKLASKFVTPSKSGEGAVMDACLYLREKYAGVLKE